MSKAEDDYKQAFGIENGDIAKPDSKAFRAHQQALDIRKFEIGLYWQRTAYFWALIAAASAGYFAVLSVEKEKLQDRDYLAFIIACIGLTFTWAWYLVNRGSKFWQENWENHVDMLEDAVTGPLYKTILSRSKDPDFFEKIFTGPAKFSVSKINQWVSCFTLFIWLMLAYHSLSSVDIGAQVFVGLVTLGFMSAMCWRGRTHKGAYVHAMSKRDTRIE